MTAKPQTNKYCTLRNLTNESSVEQFFIIRLLKDLDFKDSEILTKTSIKELVIGRGSKKENYKPDYAIKLRNKIRLLIDAKDPKENIDNYFYQISGYALRINQKYPTEDKPARLCILTNGVVTKLYNWANSTPIAELNFEDFQDGNTKFSEFQKKLSKMELVKTERQEKQVGDTFDFHPLSIEDLDPPYLHGSFCVFPEISNSITSFDIDLLSACHILLPFDFSKLWRGFGIIIQKISGCP